MENTTYEETPSKLPKEGLVRLRDLIAGPAPVIPLPKRTIDRLIDRGLFPTPRKIGRDKLWLADDIRAWLATFSSESDDQSSSPRSSTL
jgi:predicted DNA-binding transcriptional regulator AlpA